MKQGNTTDGVYVCSTLTPIVLLCTYSIPYWLLIMLYVYTDVVRMYVVYTPGYAHTSDRWTDIYRGRRRSVISVSVSLGLGLPVSRSQSTPLLSREAGAGQYLCSTYRWMVTGHEQARLDDTRRTK
jgi:hypothetical protein